jgi:hypothetical protein
LAAAGGGNFTISLGAGGHVGGEVSRAALSPTDSDLDLKCFFGLAAGKTSRFKHTPGSGSITGGGGKHVSGEPPAIIASEMFRARRSVGSALGGSDLRQTGKGLGRVSTSHSPTKGQVGSDFVSLWKSPQDANITKNKAILLAVFIVFRHQFHLQLDHPK